MFILNWLILVIAYYIDLVINKCCSAFTGNLEGNF